MRYINTPELIEKYPTLTSGVILARNIENGPSPLKVDEMLNSIEAHVSSFEPATLSRHPHISSWRQAYSSFGVKPSRYNSAAESLLRRVLKEGHLPRLNALVDICNLISLKYILPVAAYDLSKIVGDVQVGLAEGDERFLPLYAEGAERPDPGEVVYRDSEKALSRRWNWRISHEARVTEETKEALMTVEGLNLIPRGKVEAATFELKELIERFLRADVKYAILDKDRPWVDWD